MKNAYLHQYLTLFYYDNVPFTRELLKQMPKSNVTIFNMILDSFLIYIKHLPLEQT